MYTIRTGSKSEIENFQLFNEDNDGDTILVAENEAGDVVAFAQMSGCIIFFLESNEKGAGSALVNHLKGEFDRLIADHTDDISQGFWMRMGFERMGNTHNFDWYAE